MGGDAGVSAPPAGDTGALRPGSLEVRSRTEEADGKD